MYESEDPASFIQITGPAADIDEISDYMFPAGARRCDLHGRCWIEMPSITDDQAALAEANHCRIHHIQHSPYS
jgi:hypothetical protein